MHRSDDPCSQLVDWEKRMGYHQLEVKMVDWKGVRQSWQWLIGGSSVKIGAWLEMLLIRVCQRLVFCQRCMGGYCNSQLEECLLGGLEYVGGGGEVEQVEVWMKTLEEDNLVLKSKIAEMEPQLCLCTSGPMVIGKLAQLGSLSSYHSPPVAFKNNVPLPVQVEVTIDCAIGALVPIPEDKNIEAVFHQVGDKCQEFEQDISLEILQAKQDAKDIHLKICHALIVQTLGWAIEYQQVLFLGHRYPRLPSPSSLTGHKVISKGTGQSTTGSIWTRSNRSSVMDSISRSKGSHWAGKQRVSLVKIVS